MSAERIVIQDYAGVTVVTLMEPAILETAKIDALAKDLYPLIDAQNKQKLVLDLSNVKLLSSQFLGVLATLHRKSTAIKGSVSLCCVRKELLKAFTMTGMDALLRIFPTDAAALASHGVKLS